MKLSENIWGDTIFPTTPKQQQQSHVSGWLCKVSICAQKNLNAKGIIRRS